MDRSYVMLDVVESPQKATFRFSIRLVAEAVGHRYFLVNLGRSGTPRKVHILNSLRHMMEIGDHMSGLTIKVPHSDPMVAHHEGRRMQLSVDC